jgi:hypothetical protein
MKIKNVIFLVAALVFINSCKNINKNEKASIVPKEKQYHAEIDLSSQFPQKQIIVPKDFNLPEPVESKHIASKQKLRHVSEISKQEAILIESIQED